MSLTGPWGPQQQYPGYNPWPQARPGWQPVAPPVQTGPWAQPYNQPAAQSYPQPYAQTYPQVTGPWAQPAGWTAPPGIAGPPVPRRRNNHTLVMVATLVVVLVVSVTILTALMRQLAETTYATVPATPHPTYTSKSPTGTTGTAPAGTPGTPDLNPGVPPLPGSFTQATRMLTANPLYDQDLAPAACTLTDIDLATASVAEIETHMNLFVDCLMNAWYVPVADAGFQLPHPSVTVYTDPVTTACGEMPLYNASYCTADQQIYYAETLIYIFDNPMQSMRLLTEGIIAHEFGHAVQYRSMIVMSEIWSEQQAANDADAADLSRRLEMQADCFAGLFFNSVADSADVSAADRQHLQDLFRALGGTVPYSDDHGTGANRSYWVNQGLGSTHIGTCGTFTVSPDRVS